MAKAIVCVASTRTDNGNAYINYTVSLISGGTSISYSSDYQVNAAITVAANLTAWQNKIIADAAARGVTIVNSDVITFGAPS